jgi:hypothetical protein
VALRPDADRRQRIYAVGYATKPARSRRGRGSVMMVRGEDAWGSDRR